MTAIAADAQKSSFQLFQRGAYVAIITGPHKPIRKMFRIAIRADTAKTANNILLWANIRADVEALRLGRALGVEPAKLREAMAIGSGANRPLAEWGKHRLRWPHKDLEVALAVAAEAGVELPLVEQLPRLLRELSVDDLHELL